MFLIYASKSSCFFCQCTFYCIFIVSSIVYFPFFGVSVDTMKMPTPGKYPLFKKKFSHLFCVGCDAVDCGHGDHATQGDPRQRGIFVYLQKAQISSTHYHKQFIWILKGKKPINTHSECLKLILDTTLYYDPRFRGV